MYTVWWFLQYLNKTKHGVLDVSFRPNHKNSQISTNVTRCVAIHRASLIWKHPVQFPPVSFHMFPNQPRCQLPMQDSAVMLYPYLKKWLYFSLTLHIWKPPASLDIYRKQTPQPSVVFIGVCLPFQLLYPPGSPYLWQVKAGQTHACLCVCKHYTWCIYVYMYMHR